MTSTDTTRTAAQAEPTIDEIRDLIQSGEFRADFTHTFSLSQGTLPCVRLYRHNGKRWLKVDPLLLPPQGEGSDSLLRIMASLAEPGSE